MPSDQLHSTENLVALARQIAANDCQARADTTPTVDGHRGSLLDRTTELLLPMPGGVTLSPA